MNKIIAVVGMSGTGKSVVTDCLENKGWKKSKRSTKNESRYSTYPCQYRKYIWV